MNDCIFNALALAIAFLAEGEKWNGVDDNFLLTIKFHAIHHRGFSLQHV